MNIAITRQKSLTVPHCPSTLTIILQLLFLPDTFLIGTSCFRKQTHHVQGSSHSCSHRGRYADASCCPVPSWHKEL
ncbi:hypothetical protein BDV3_002437 [Batrachochytrium dendrobatidis]